MRHPTRSTESPAASARMRPGAPRRRAVVGFRRACAARLPAAALALPALWALILLCEFSPVSAAAPARRTGADDAKAGAEAVLARMPPGSRASQAQWIFSQARSHPDARVALRLVDEVVRRGEGPITIEARLWRVRYWMAAGRNDEAARELRAIPALPSGAPGDAEKRFWSALVGEGGEPPASAPSRNPPWELLAQLASIRPEQAGRDGVRFALSLEGAVRRAGLLGAWLWRLHESGQATLARMAREMAAAPAAGLAGSPERAAILAGSSTVRAAEPRRDEEAGSVERP